MGTFPPNQKRTVDKGWVDGDSKISSEIPKPGKKANGIWTIAYEDLDQKIYSEMLKNILWSIQMQPGKIIQLT